MWIQFQGLKRLIEEKDTVPPILAWGYLGYQMRMMRRFASPTNFAGPNCVLLRRATHVNTWLNV